MKHFTINSMVYVIYFTLYTHYNVIFFTLQEISPKSFYLSFQNYILLPQPSFFSMLIFPESQFAYAPQYVQFSQEYPCIQEQISFENQPLIKRTHGLL